jgi:RES domain-containing protein
MPAAGRVHDRAVLDALEAIGAEAFGGRVWRVTREGRDPLRGSTVHGRWSPSGEFDVLYTSLVKQGALAEVGYRLSLEPVWPSRIAHVVHTVDVLTDRTLRFATLDQLAALGVDVSHYQSFDYAATQAIAAAAHFLEFDGLIAPSARYSCSNLVIFLDRISDQTRLDVGEAEPVDWQGWRTAAAKAR